MNILLTGASGFIGAHLYARLVREGHDVTACVRDPRRFMRRHPGARAVACDFARDTDPTAWAPRLDGIDVVVNAVGIIREARAQTFAALHRDTPTALFEAAARCGVGKVIQISALGADGGAESRYHLTKRAADDALAALEMRWTILRPSIVYGPGAKSTALFRALASLPVTPLVGDGDQPIQPIHVEDLADVVVQALTTARLDGRRLDLVGPEPLSMRAYLERQRTWLGDGPLKALPVPYGVALRLAKLGGFWGSAPIDGETVAMLKRGNTGDVRPLVAACGVMPRSVDDALTASPASQADRWHARLYFLAPALRVALAAVWMLTGLVSAFVFPQEQSYALLRETGITGAWAPVALYGAAAVDFGLGLALLLRVGVARVALAQIAMMVGYTVIITVALPEYWAHPYGPVSKNLALIVATWMVAQMEVQ